MNKMTASNIWYSGKLCKAENRQKKGANFNYEYDITLLYFVFYKRYEVFEFQIC